MSRRYGLIASAAVQIILRYVCNLVPTRRHLLLASLLSTVVSEVKWTKFKTSVFLIKSISLKNEYSAFCLLAIDIFNKIHYLIFITQ